HHAEVRDPCQSRHRGSCWASTNLTNGSASRLHFFFCGVRQEPACVARQSVRRPPQKSTRATCPCFNLKQLSYTSLICRDRRECWKNPTSVCRTWPHVT